MSDKNNGAHISAQSRKTIMLAKMGMMLAISVVFLFIPTFPMLPGVDFIHCEFSDIPILISAFAFGTPAGLVIATLTVLFDVILGHAQAVPYGPLMHLIAIATYALVAGLIYGRRKNLKHAVVGLICGILAMTAIMVPANLIVTPAFLGVPVQAITPLILPAIVPANIMKGLLAAVLTFILYKRVSPFLHKW